MMVSGWAWVEFSSLCAINVPGTKRLERSERVKRRTAVGGRTYRVRPFPLFVFCPRAGFSLSLVCGSSVAEQTGDNQLKI